MSDTDRTVKFRPRDRIEADLHQLGTVLRGLAELKHADTLRGYYASKLSDIRDAAQTLWNARIAEYGETLWETYQHLPEGDWQLHPNEHGGDGE